MLFSPLSIVRYVIPPKSLHVNLPRLSVIVGVVVVEGVVVAVLVGVVK